ncbi:hypothetical protein JGU66_26840 [Myxococcaceae bacterium JPH2]|nr:hypothetical protein [Myxococcaceae bacterium JPH2]
MLMALVLTWALAGAAEPNPIDVENTAPGSTQWRLGRAAVGAQLEGYAGASSVQHGESIDVHARTDGNHTVRWEVYRMGYYRGVGGRRVASGGPISVGPQPTPSADPSTGLLECHWPTSFTVQTEPSWATGVYVIKLLRDDGLQSYVLFVVRSDERKGAALVQVPVTTFQAYNFWGGESLYNDSLGLSGGHAKRVSFDRPYANGNGSGEYFNYVHQFVLWAEAKGHDLVYVTNPDLDRDPSLLLGQRLFLAVGHDEYWSRPGREAVVAALASGVNLAFLAGDTSCWLIRLEPSFSGVPRRRQVCFKDEAPREDPLAHSNVITVRWRNPLLNEPENGLVGVMSDSWALINQPFVVRNAGAWPFEGTGLADGDTLLAMAGYEIDREWDNGHSPAGLVPLATSPVIGSKGEPNWHAASVYTAPSGAFVFAAGGVAWSLGLSHFNFADLRVQRITDNVFARAGLVAPHPGDTFGAGRERPVDRTGQSLGVTTFAGGAFQEGWRDGPALEARFRRPVGLAVDSAGNVFVADTGNHVIRMIANDAAHTVSTIAGTGAAGVGEGPGARAALRLPESVTLGPDSSLYVADTGNHRVVRIARDGRWTVSTFVGSKEGRSGMADGLGTAARFQTPMGVAFAGSDLFIADTLNHRLARVTPDGRVTTVVGARGAGSGDGPASRARLNRPTALAAGSGAVWLVDTGNRALRRVALDASFTTSTVAGSYPGGFSDGTGGSARFMPMLGVTVAGMQVLVSDTGNERIRAVSGGRARTFAGSGAAGTRDGPAEQATFSLPTGIAVLPGGDALVVDQGDSTLRRLRVPPSMASGRPR